MRIIQGREAIVDENMISSVLDGQLDIFDVLDYVASTKPDALSEADDPLAAVEDEDDQIEGAIEGQMSWCRKL